MSDVIKFEFDQPVEVALRYAEPKVFASQFPGGDDRHMYSTTDGRVMYVTPLTSARIKALQLAQAECFWICKRKAGRLTEFAVSRESMPASPQPAAPRPARPPAPFKTNLPSHLYYTPPASEHGPSATLEEQLQSSIDMVERRKVGEQGDGPLAIMGQREGSCDNAQQAASARNRVTHSP
jgi:hypothetical protein